jgi:hypothetical protein
MPNRSTAVEMADCVGAHFEYAGGVMDYGWANPDDYEALEINVFQKNEEGKVFLFTVYLAKPDPAICAATKK